MTFAEQVCHLACALCRGWLQLSFPVDADGNRDKDRNPYCNNCGEYVRTVQRRAKKTISDKPPEVESGT